MLFKLARQVLIFFIANGLWDELEAYPGPKMNEGEGISVWSNEVPEAIGRAEVRKPRLKMAWPPLMKVTGTEIIICPGGRGYIQLDRSRNGNALTQWLNSLGAASSMVKYRFGLLSLSGNVAGRAAGAMLCMHSVQ
jgi:hypothetical protein